MAPHVTGEDYCGLNTVVGPLEWETLLSMMFPRMVNTRFNSSITYVQMVTCFKPQTITTHVNLRGVNTEICILIVCTGLTRPPLP